MASAGGDIAVTDKRLELKDVTMTGSDGVVSVVDPDETIRVFPNLTAFFRFGFEYITLTEDDISEWYNSKAQSGAGRDIIADVAESESLGNVFLNVGYVNPYTGVSTSETMFIGNFAPCLPRYGLRKNC